MVSSSDGSGHGQCGIVTFWRLAASVKPWKGGETRRWNEPSEVEGALITPQREERRRRRARATKPKVPSREVVGSGTLARKRISLKPM